MKKRYIKPHTSVIVQQTEGPLLAGSDDGNPYAAKPRTLVDDDWGDDEHDNASGPEQKNEWNE